MKRAIVTIAIGELYSRLEEHTGFSREAYAKAHGWEYIVVRELPKAVFALHPTRPERFVSLLTKLLLPEIFPDYDLLLFMDNDSIVRRGAPCLSGQAPHVPAGGFAAVQTVTQEERRRYFPRWRPDYYADLEEMRGLRATIPRRDLYINSGLLLFRPGEVRAQWRELFEMDSALTQENRLNAVPVQQGLCHLLPKEWNVLWYYEKVRRGWGVRETSRVARGINKVLWSRLFWAVERNRFRQVLKESELVHFAFENHKVEYMLSGRY